MSKNPLSPAQAIAIMAAIKNFSTVAQELSNVLQETGYELSNSTPPALTDVDDFTYDIMSWAEDEVEEIQQRVIDKCNTVT